MKLKYIIHCKLVEDPAYFISNDKYKDYNILTNAKVWRYDDKFDHIDIKRTIGAIRTDSHLLQSHKTN